MANEKKKMSFEQDYLSIVLRQLKKNKLGIAGFFFIIFLAVVAIFAPFLADETPLRITHSNETDAVCDVCIELKESWDVLELKDGTVLEGTFIRELPIIIFDLPNGETLKFTKDKVDVVRTDRTPNTLRLLDRTTYTGTFRGEKPGVVEFAVDGERKEWPASEKVKLYKVPKKHDARAIWPLLRSLDRTDRYLLLVLGTLVAGVFLFFPLRKKGLSRGRAFKVTSMILGGPFLILAILTGIREGERQLYKTVPFAELELKQKFSTETKRDLQASYNTISVTWPLLSRFGPETPDLPLTNEGNKGARVITHQPPLWMPLTENDQKTNERLALDNVGENWKEYAAEHLLGTDSSKRDVLSMMIHGTRISLAVGVVSVSIYVTIGIIVGAIAGYFGGWVDDIIMRVVEIVICFPTFFLIITIIAIAPPRIEWVMVAIALVGWTTVARLVRAEFLKLRKNDFVISAKALGASQIRIIFRHILPNSLAPVMVSATFGVAGAILVESSLSFLGLGVQPHIATWGSVLKNGQESLPATWWLALIPGLAIFMTVTAYNLFGEALRDAIDPRLKGTQ